MIFQNVLNMGNTGWKKVVSPFGDDILQPDVEVDRPKLGQLIFSNPKQRILMNWYLPFCRSFTL
ncbi:unnamed protein product, partial [Prunus brigantina]